MTAAEIVGCGHRGHDEDCLCDLVMPEGPAAPARFPAAAVVEIAEAWGTEDVSPADLLRAGRSFADVARATGLDEPRVLRLAGVIGVQSKRAKGGGYKYDREQYGAVLRLRSEGVSYSAIAAATGVPRNAVIGICRRRTAA